MSDEVRVQPSDLTAKANQIRGLTFASAQAQPPLISADALIIASVAVTNIAQNAENLWAYQEYGRLEGQRLAQTLDNVAGAYIQIDQQSGEGIGSTFDVPGGAPGGPVIPKTTDIPAPPRPPKMPIPKGQLASEQGFMDPQSAQTALDAGDDAASLRAAATMWRANADSLAASAEEFEVNSTDWEGQAADAAYAKFNAYRDWLISLSGSWKRLADEAEVAATAHSKAKSDHEPIAQRYRELSQQVVDNPPYSPAWVDAMNKIAEEQKKSEEVRNTYAREAVVNQIEPEEPPAPVVSGMPVTAEDHRRARPYREGEPAGSGGGGGQQAPGGGSGGGAPQEAPISPMSAGDPAAQAAQAAQQAGQQAGQQGGGSPSGGSPGGGQPGGGQPGGGAPGGGMPGLGKGDPKSPNDPKLRPAAARGGGGAGGGSGGGGGGMPGVPLQPAVGAETVAPTPYAASAGPAAGAAGAAAGGAAAGGGGMGGMAPMHGAHGAGGSGDKKRNPQLSQDEEIYTEKRPHTEPVIGLQPRRRPGSDGTRKES
ncbi:MAG: PPE domain-containing protein [Mycobacterium kyogaense]|uniref:PPE domain-containing protein n=1 Tax=Mycobacterium kyogaense TaxID=2212479 RepID=UPI002FFA438F